MDISSPHAPHVYISYSHCDIDFALVVKNALEDAGFQVWMDEKIPAGDHWRSDIEQAIIQANVLILVITPESQSSQYVTYEWAFALGRQKKLIPLLRTRTPGLHPILEGLQYLDFSHFSSRPWSKLIERLNNFQV